MSVRSILIVVTCALLAAGCRRDPRLQVYIDNVNAEKRMLEDTLYDLQYDYECKLREVEKLQSELDRVKGASTDSGAAKPGSSRLKSPAASGNRLFPDLSDLEPPSVEPGTPDTERQRPKTEPEGAKPGTERPKPPAQDDVDDLEPPTLELPDEPADSPQPKDADAKPDSAPNVTPREVDQARAAGEQTEEQLSDSRALERSQSISGKPDGKVEDRWTPRSARRPDPPKRSIRLADAPSPGTAAGSAQPAGTGSLSDGAATPGVGGATDPRQANRPTWRPYR